MDDKLGGEPLTPERDPMDPKLLRPCPNDEAIRYLCIPDDAAPWVMNCSHFDGDYPRRLVFGQPAVVPLQLAKFIIARGNGYLLENGPAAFLLEEDEVEDFEGDNEEEDVLADDEGEGDEDEEGAREDKNDDGDDRRDRTTRRPRRR